MSHILVVDNYDSFVYTIVGYLAELGAEVTVLRNDVPELGSPRAVHDYDGVLVSPRTGRAGRRRRIAGGHRGVCELRGPDARGVPGSPGAG